MQAFLKYAVKKCWHIYKEGVLGDFSPNQRHLYYKVRIWQIPMGI